MSRSDTTNSSNTSSSRPIRRKVAVLLLIVIIVVSTWMVGWWGGGSAGSDDVIMAPVKHNPSTLLNLPENSDLREKHNSRGNPSITIATRRSQGTTNHIATNDNISTTMGQAVVEGARTSESAMSCGANGALKQRIQYFEDSLSDTTALINSGEQEPIIRAGSSSGGSGSKFASSKFSLKCAHQAFEDNFRASLLGKKAELQTILKHLKALLLSVEGGLNRKGGGENVEQAVSFPIETSKKGNMLPTFNWTSAHANQLFTPLITIDELVYGPCQTSRGDDCKYTTTASSSSSSVATRRNAIEAVISSSSSSNDGTPPMAATTTSKKGIHVYMVHYTPMKQRREIITKLLHKHRIAPEWVTGFDKDDINTKTSGCITGGETSLKPSQISVVIKHHSALYDAVRYKRPLSLILEDDALLRYDVAERLGDLLVEAYQHHQKRNQKDLQNPVEQNYFDVMWVGGCIKMHGYRRKYSTVQVSPHLFEKREARCAHAYLVSYKGAQRLLGNFPLSRPIDFQLTDAMKTAATSAAAPGVVSLWVEPWLSIQGDMGGCVTNDIGAKCITVVKKYDPAFDGEKLPVVCTADAATEVGNSTHLFLDLGWNRVPKHGSS